MAKLQVVTCSERRCSWLNGTAPVLYPIGVFKTLLRLQKEFQGRSYDLLVSHTIIVFSRYILLAWQHRQSTDAHSFGGLFDLLCDEVGTMDWTIALQQLLDLINEIAAKAGKSFSP